MSHLLQKNDPLEALLSLKDAKAASNQKRFFKTGKGDYAEHDIFLGISVPTLRGLAKTFKDIPQKVLNSLMISDFHEARMLALFILVNRFKNEKDPAKQIKIVNYYLSKMKYINNWDLVDCSAHHIVGAYFYNNDRKIVMKLFNANDLWERRIAIVATWFFIKQNDFSDILKMAKKALTDNRDLIQKAVGWMLREMGKRDERPLIDFLNDHAATMPRTMLRYAIERLSDKQKKHYMQAKVVA